MIRERGATNGPCQPCSTSTYRWLIKLKLRLQYDCSPLLTLECSKRYQYVRQSLVFLPQQSRPVQM